MKSSNCKKIEEVENETSYDQHVWTLLILIALFFFFYVGAEVSYGIYITTFAVECDLIDFHKL